MIFKSRTSSICSKIDFLIHIHDSLESNKFKYSEFHQFGQAKFASGGSILSSRKCLRSLRMMLAIKVVRINSKIIISLPGSKLMKQTLPKQSCTSMDLNLIMLRQWSISYLNVQIRPKSKHSFVCFACYRGCLLNCERIVLEANKNKFNEIQNK